MIVEMVGCPGAGKTTLLPALVDALGRRGIVARHVNDAARPFVRRTLPDRLLRLLPRSLERRVCWTLFVAYRAAYALRVVIGHPRLMRHLWQTQRHRPAAANARERRVLHWYLRMMGAREFVRRRARVNEAVVFDEGFVHRVVQLHTSEVERAHPRVVRDYAALIPRADLLVHVRAPAEVCAGRVTNRGVWAHLTSRDAAALERFIDHAHAAVTTMVDELRRLDWPIVDVDNGGDGANEAVLGLDAGLGLDGVAGLATSPGRALEGMPA